MFDTLKQITDAVDRGEEVYWKNNAYQLIKDNSDQYLIKCCINNDVASLYWVDGSSSSYNPKDFYIV